MTHLERFKAVANGQKPDYVPIFGFMGAPGFSRCGVGPTRDHLVATGMPEHVGIKDGEMHLQSWEEYWGVTGAVAGLSIAEKPRGFASKSRIEGEYEIVEDESGAVTRQVINNDVTYSMPEFITYPVRDRKSWEFYKERMTPRGLKPKDEIETRIKELEQRDRPLVIQGIRTYGQVRNLMGVEAASMALYDDPELVQDICQFYLDQFLEYRAPLIERLRPEIVKSWEDIGYNVGMLISPSLFEEICLPMYRKVAEVARAAEVDVVTVDSDGHAMTLFPLLHKAGLNSMYPFEAKGENDLFELQEKYPDGVFFGWIEKEIVNEGNEALIESEIMNKVPRLLEKGRYFPNGDHGLQPMVTFPSLCKAMALLHEVCGNPGGEYPKM